MSEMLERVKAAWLRELAAPGNRTAFSPYWQNQSMQEHAIDDVYRKCARAAVEALQAQNSGFMYPAQLPDGTTKTFSEAQVVAMVLEELRQQVQLVVGHAVWLGDLRKFLQANKVEP